MCGVAGLFVGCETSACPIATAAASTEEPYVSPFSSWYERSGVRAKPRRTVSRDAKASRFLDDGLVPLLSHHLVKALPEEDRRRVNILHTYRYLDFTATLENLVVNPVATSIARGTIGIELPMQMRLDAYKIACDEAYHALFSADLSAQIFESTGLRDPSERVPYFLRRLETVLHDMDSRDVDLVKTLFVVCSEMLISATLAQPQPRPGTDLAVFEAVRDHAQDEGRHHAYFSEFLRHLWAQSDARSRRLIGANVPALVLSFMAPDVQSMRSELGTYGFSPAESDEILEETFPRPMLQASAANASAHITRTLADLGAFDLAETRDAFAASGLIAEGEPL